jgi:hypothetical protein
MKYPAFRSQDHFIEDISTALESKSHGEFLQKFIAKDDGGPDGDFSVEIHGFVDQNGKFIIISEQFHRKDDK